MSTRPPSRVVFVGNIPYGLTEEQISDIFSSAGKVLNFRLVYDRETGRPKGFGFAEYPDADSAASAVRNLNDHEIMGRKLRVDFSNEGVDDGEGKGDGVTNMYHNAQSNGASSSNNNANHSHIVPMSNQTSSTSLPPLPQGKELPPGVSCADAISRTLNALPPTQLLDIISQFKTMATNDPARATELLNQAPQLSYALFQALLMMDLIPPEAIHSALEPGQVPPPTMLNAALAAAPSAAPSAAPAAPAMPYASAGFPAGATVTPPVALATAGAAAAPLAQDPEVLMMAVMNLPQVTIDQLPEGERQQIMALRAQYASMQRQ